MVGERLPWKAILAPLDHCSACSEPRVGPEQYLVINRFFISKSAQTAITPGIYLGNGMSLQIGMVNRSGHHAAESVVLTSLSWGNNGASSFTRLIPANSSSVMVFSACQAQQ